MNKNIRIAKELIKVAKKLINANASLNCKYSYNGGDEIKITISYDFTIPSIEELIHIASEIKHERQRILEGLNEFGFILYSQEFDSSKICCSMTLKSMYETQPETKTISGFKYNSAIEFLQGNGYKRV